MKKQAGISGVFIMFSFAVLANPALAGDAAKGKSIFAARCQPCHGQGGDAGNKGGIKAAANFANLDANPPRIKELLSTLTEADHKKIVTNGGAKSGVAGAGSGMPKLGLPENEIDDVVAYERTLPAFHRSGGGSTGAAAAKRPAPDTPASSVAPTTQVQAPATPASGMAPTTKHRTHKSATKKHQAPEIPASGVTATQK
jgi:mono/diheme cytochrome c family protein